MGHYAIISGDIVNSTRMNEAKREWLIHELSEAFITWDKDFKIKTEITRGDSFQCLVNDRALALKVALIIKTYIRKLSADYYIKNGKVISIDSQHQRVFPINMMFDARIAIGIGEINYLQKKLAISNGEAFTLSGHTLDMMKSKKQLFAIASNDSNKASFEIESILLDAILSKTSATQCEVINLKLLGYTEVEIAEMLHINQSAVNQRSNIGNWNAIDAFVKYFENIYNNE